MAFLSKQTLGLAIRLLQTLTWTDIELLLYEHDIPTDLAFGSSKKERLLRLFQGLEQLNQTDTLLGFIQAGMQALPESSQQELEGALIRDGYVSTGNEVIPDEPRAAENKIALKVLVERNPGELQSNLLLHHLQQAEEHFRDEKWDSSIGQARKFVELLLVDIAKATATRRGEGIDTSKPVKVREYLQKCGFFDESERKKLVDGVYGYFSDEGAHPGISTHSAARLCLSVLWTFGFYLLEKFETWRSQGYRPI